MSPLLSPLSSHALVFGIVWLVAIWFAAKAGTAMSIEHVEAVAMHRDIDRAEQWAAEPYSADDTRPTRAETDADQWHRAWDDDEGHTWADMVRDVAVDSTGWGYLPGHAPIYVGLDGA